VYSVIPDTTDANSLVYRYVNEVSLTAPVQEGQRVSTLQIWCGNICIAQSDLYAMSSVLPAGQVFTTEETPVEKGNALRIILSIVGLVLAAALICVIVRSLVHANRLAKKRRQSRRNSRNRRRSR